MKGSRLDKLLAQLGLNDTGTVFFNDGENRFDVSLHFDTKKRLELIKPDAIYVFNNQPFILFFDLTDKENKEREDDIHKKVWSFDNSPVIFVIKGKEIIVYNALNYIKNDKKLQEITFETEAEKNEKFSFWNLQSGFTWKWLQEEIIEKSQKKETQKRVNERLFQNIKDVREELVKLNMPESHANSLILRLIFIRYLIDREVEINISGKDINEKRECFCKLILQTEKLNQLFTYLNDRFNGILFKDLNIVITLDQAEFLANVFRGEVQEKGTIFEGYFFEIFDFSVIPVELISGIYETLIDEETQRLNSAVYTPPFLVDYILNETVDKYLDEQNVSECKIFEVAVGSGIFLVQSLRRMIEKEIKLNGNADNKEFSQKIREIAEKNLFGIDIEKEALKVTCFSIYIALLDYQEPKDIDKYRFPDLLEKNLFEANFFDTEHSFNEKMKSEKPDFILGNPPWKSKKDDEIHTNWVKKNNETVGGYEIAQSFLLRTKDFMQPNTKAALIVTSTMFYNVSNTSRTFKNKFLTIYCIEKFFDLSPVRRLIFEEKNSPASIVYFRLPKNEDEYLTNIVKHQSVKINYFLKYFKMLVIEKFDQKEIQQRHFIDYDWMFKVALYGNVLDFLLLRKIYSNKKTLNDYIDNKTIYKGDGILTGTPKPDPFLFLVGMPIVENAEIQPYYTNVNKEKTLSDKDVFLESGRIKELFFGEHIYLKLQTLQESDIVVSYGIDNAVHRHDVLSLTSEQSINKLKELYSFLISNLHKYFQFLSASAWGVSTRPAIKVLEYLSFPIIEPDKKTKTKLIYLVNRFLKPFQEHYAKFNMGEPQPNKKLLAKINNIIYELYGIRGYEKDLIDYVLNVSRYQFQESKQHLLNFTSEKNHSRNRELVLQNYAEVYLQEFQKIYDDEFMQVEIYPLNHFIAMNFKFLDTKPEKQIEYPDNKEETAVFKLFANKLSISQETNTADPTENLFIQKDIKGFEENSFYIIKPNEYKCWHRAMAWYDVAEFMERIETAELKQFNQFEE